MTAHYFRYRRNIRYRYYYQLAFLASYAIMTLPGQKPEWVGKGKEGNMSKPTMGTNTVNCPTKCPYRKIKEGKHVCRVGYYPPWSCWKG